MNAKKILAILALLLFVSCTQEDSKTQTTTETIQWSIFDYTGLDKTPYPSNDKKTFNDYDQSFVLLGDTLSGLYNTDSVPEDLKRKIIDYQQVDQSVIHQDLLNLKGRRIDIIGMNHVGGGMTDSQREEAITSQNVIVEIIKHEKYDIVFTEDLTSDVGLATKEKIIADMKREAVDAGMLFKTDRDIEDEVYRPIVDARASAAFEIFSSEPTISVVGVDYYPIKRIQQHMMGLGMEGNLFSEEKFNRFMFGLTFSRDIYLLRSIALKNDLRDKKCVVVFGVIHVPHLAKLLKDYGASGRVFFDQSFLTNERFVSATNLWNVSFGSDNVIR